ncbi:MAG TPA: hypothetical protein VFI25_14050 [Planctomycetota bacterium]|jgi:ribose 5-phosphate isomerase|nr:hypothetical protein [Planctomycetota bacterium]
MTIVTDDPAVQTVAAHALDPLADGARVGLGSRRATASFIARLGAPLGDGHAAREVERALLAIPGVVDMGFFLGTAERALAGDPDGRVDALRPLGP